ncbi:MAG: hypothetical protein ACI4WT_02565 [Oligosphaeraceae bacterium]
MKPHPLLSLLAAAALLLPLASPAQRQALGAASAYVWFDQLERPCALSESQLADIAARVRRHLLDRGGDGIREFAAALPDDPSPRVVFVTIGDDAWPARTYFGTGFSFGDALATALEILAANEQAKRAEVVKQANAVLEEARREGRPVPREWAARRDAPGAWHWLKLHVVQATRTYGHFTFNRSRFALPDLIGFAFAPALGFAFTPDQITGRYLLTPNGFISRKQVGNVIAETFNFNALSTWLALSSIDQEQRLCLFESDVYYADAAGACRLFRAHRLPAIPDADACRAAAAAVAKALAPHVSRRDGAIEPPFPDWRAGDARGESPDDLAECAIALQELADALGGGEAAVLRELAGALVRPLREAMLDFGPRNGLRALAIPEPLPEGSPRQPRTIAPLRHSALALVALARTGQPEDARLAGQLADFLVSLHRGDGTFHHAVTVPKASPIDYPEAQLAARLTDHALAVAALAAAARVAPADQAREWSRLAALARTRLAHDCAGLRDTDLPDVTALAAALTSADRPDGPQHDRLVRRLAATLIAVRDPSPLAPDLVGAPRGRASYLAAARAAWAASRLALWLKPLAPEFADALAAENALPTTFHLQAQLDDAAATPLPRPKSYRGFCRTTPDAYEFTLPAQTWQMRALACTARLLAGYPNGQFPDLPAAQAQLDRARRFIDLHPGFLQSETISNQHGVSEEARSATMGQLSHITESKASPKEAEQLFLQPPRR